MSATIALNAPVARNINATTSLVQLGLMIAGLFLALVLFNAFAGKVLVSEMLTTESGVLDQDAGDDVDTVAIEAAVDPLDALTPGMRHALAYVTRRYRVSQDALLPIFEAAQTTGRERGLDPLLIVAIIGIESGFNPLAESSFGAQGLMQVIPRFHKEKLPQGAGSRPLLDPVTNVQVGVHVLQESIRRRGGLVAGLQHYAGSPSAEGAYASKVLAEKRRLEQGVQRTQATGA